MTRPCKYLVGASGRTVPSIEFSTKYKDEYYAIIRAKRMRELLPAEYTTVSVFNLETKRHVWDSRDK